MDTSLALAVVVVLGLIAIIVEIGLELKQYLNNRSEQSDSSTAESNT